MIRLKRYFLPAALIFLALAFSEARVFDLFEFQTYDWRCRFRGPRPVSQDIVLVEIWDDALREFGAWPFDRHYHADLIKILGEFGAKAVAFDIFFVEPREGDEAVAEAAKKAGNVYFSEACYQPFFKDGKTQSKKVITPLLPSYREAARGVGHVNPKPDRDGKRRRIFPVIDVEGKKIHHLGFKIAMDQFGIREEDLGKNIPLDDDRCFLVNYAGRWEKTFRHYSYYDLIAAYVEHASGLKPRIPLEALQGKICFVGLTSLGSHDTSPVPVQSVYPMLGMHANVLNSILERDFIRRVGRLLNLLLLIVPSLFILWVSKRCKPALAFLISLATALLFAAAVVFGFVRWGWWFDLFYPMLLFTVIFAVSVWIRAVSEIRKRELLESELKIAAEIQKSFLPASMPKIRGLDLAVHFKPAKAVGGDLYAFVLLSETKIGLMVGDVSGKGVPAALFMAKVASEFKFSAAESDDPSAVLASLNRSVASDSTGGLFVTLTYVIVDLEARVLCWSSAGHLPLIKVSRGGDFLRIQQDSGMPIGVLPDGVFPSVRVLLEKDDCFVLYSDGVSEARDSAKEEFGIARLEELVGRYRAETSEAVKERVVGRLENFVGGAEPHDDMTLLVAKVNR